MPENFLTPPPGGLQLQNQQQLERLNALEALVISMKIEISALKDEHLILN